MGLICSRIGCREKAAASLQFDAGRSTAILIDLTHARNGMPLCERHASTRTAPVGWQMVDRRTGAKKMEMWSAEDEGRPAPDFAAPTDRPAARRPAEAQRRRADDAAGSQASPTGPRTSSSTTGSPTAGVAAKATPEDAPTADPRPTRPATRRPADPEPEANRPDSRRVQAGRPDSEDDELEAEPVESTTEFRWPKQSDEPESDKEDLGADSPLLSRAFRAAK